MEKDHYIAYVKDFFCNAKTDIDRNMEISTYIHTVSHLN